MADNKIKRLIDALYKSEAHKNSHANLTGNNPYNLNIGTTVSPVEGFSVSPSANFVMQNGKIIPSHNVDVDYQKKLLGGVLDVGGSVGSNKPTVRAKLRYNF